MKKIKFIFTLLTVLYLNNLHGQDLHFSRVQDMVLWYNPSLKNDTRTSLRMNYRDVRYQGLLGYRSSAMMVDLPVISQIANKEIDAKNMQADKKLEAEIDATAARLAAKPDGQVPEPQPVDTDWDK